MLIYSLDLCLFIGLVMYFSYQVFLMSCMAAGELRLAYLRFSSSSIIALVSNFHKDLVFVLTAPLPNKRDCHSYKPWYISLRPDTELETSCRGDKPPNLHRLKFYVCNDPRSAHWVMVNASPAYKYVQMHYPKLSMRATWAFPLLLFAGRFF